MLLLSQPDDVTDADGLCVAGDGLRATLLARPLEQSWCSAASDAAGQLAADPNMCAAASLSTLRALRVPTGTLVVLRCLGGPSRPAHLHALPRGAGEAPRWLSGLCEGVELDHAEDGVLYLSPLLWRNLGGGGGGHPMPPLAVLVRRGSADTSLPPVARRAVVQPVASPTPQQYGWPPPRAPAAAGAAAAAALRRHFRQPRLLCSPLLCRPSADASSRGRLLTPAARRCRIVCAGDVFAVPTGAGRRGGGASGGGDESSDSSSDDEAARTPARACPH